MPSAGPEIVVVHASMCQAVAHALPSHFSFHPKIKCDLFPFCAAEIQHRETCIISQNLPKKTQMRSSHLFNLLMQSVRFDFGHLIHFQLFGVRRCCRFRHFRRSFLPISCQWIKKNLRVAFKSNALTQNVFGFSVQRRSAHQSLLSMFDRWHCLRYYGDRFIIIGHKSGHHFHTREHSDQVRQAAGAFDSKTNNVDLLLIYILSRSSCNYRNFINERLCLCLVCVASDRSMSSSSTQVCVRSVEPNFVSFKNVWNVFCHSSRSRLVNTFRVIELVQK